MAKHNKKRNVGLLYEQLMRFASNSILEKNRPRAEKAIDILCQRFKPGTELYKEFRLFNALVDSKVSNSTVARRIIEESKKACLQHDKNQLRKEKSALIKEINHSLGGQDFYNQKSSNYRTHATVQALLNEWRGASTLNPAELVKYEMVLEEWLTRDDVSETSIKKEHANPLTLNIMFNKFKEKYENKMNEEQQSLFESFLHNDSEAIVEKVSAIKNRAKRVIEGYFVTCENKILIEKRSNLESRIDNLPIDSDQSSVSKAMVLSSLLHEMEAKNV